MSIELSTTLTMSNLIYVYCFHQELYAAPVCLYKGPQRGFGPDECCSVIQHLLDITVLDDVTYTYGYTFDIPRNADIQRYVDATINPYYINVVRNMFCEKFRIAVVGKKGLNKFLATH